MKIMSVKYAVPGNVVTNENIIDELKDRIDSRVDVDTRASILRNLEKTLE